MAGFCTKCGRPLPESGVCPCSAQQSAAAWNDDPFASQPAPAPRPASGAAAQLPALLAGYFSDPVKTSRLAAEKRQMIPGVLCMAAMVFLTFVQCLIFAARYYFSMDSGAANWVVTGLFSPVIAIVLTLGLLLAILAIAKVRIDFPAIVAVLGINLLIPIVLTVLSTVFSLISLDVYRIFCILTYASWVVAFFLIVMQVYNIKLNIINVAVLILGIAFSYLLIALLREWFIEGIAAYNVNDLLGELTDLWY